MTATGAPRLGPVGLARAAVAVARHPGLWPVAVRQALRLRAPGRLGPSPDYLAFRLVTQYGTNGHDADPQDVVSYLRWCRQWRAFER